MKSKMLNTILVPAPRARAHRMLFEQNTPFKAKTQRVRVAYQRHAKHAAQVDKNWL